MSASSADRTPSATSSRRNRGISASEKGGDGDNSTLFDPEDAEAFEGNSSLAAHTAFASEFCKRFNSVPFPITLLRAFQRT